MEFPVMLSRLAVLPFLFFSISYAAWAQEPVFPPGSRWGIVPPPGFELETRATVRFVHPSGAYIVLAEMPVPLRDVAVGEVGTVTGGGAAATRLDSIEEIVLDGREAIRTTSRLVSTSADMLAVIVQGNQNVGMAAAAIPDAAKAATDNEELWTSLLSLVERSLGADEQLAGFPVVFGDLADMRIASVVTGNLVLLTDGPANDMENAVDQPYLLLSATRDGRVLDVSRSVPLLKADIGRQFPGATIVSSGPIETIGGLAAEIVYKRRHPNGQMLDGRIWGLAAGDVLVTMAMQFPEGEDDLVERFARIRDGMKPR